MTTMARAATTEPRAGRGQSRRRSTSGPDRLTVALFAAAGFLAVLALLAWQMNSSPAGPAPRPVIVMRRVYETRIVETIRRSAPGTGGTSVSQSVSSSGSPPASNGVPTTRTSSAR